MKLYFLRHGRADRSAWNGDDFNRPLTPRGIEITEASAEMMDKLDLGLDLILSSPLARALQTAEIAAAGLNLMDRLVVDVLQTAQPSSRLPKIDMATPDSQLLPALAGDRLTLQQYGIETPEEILVGYVQR